MKILSIGNSFSQDAHKWLNKLAKANGLEIATTNLYIGGCSLETHWDNAVHGNEYYDLEPDRGEGIRKISISEALSMDDWDVITLQQVSQLSGMPDSYEPYLSNLAQLVRETCPRAELYFHQTWAYETDSDHDGFANYHRNQGEMYEAIVSTTEIAAKSIGAGLIPSGRAIQLLRGTVPEFDYQKGGLSLNRDGFHLSLDYGRYAAAGTWIRTLTGAELTNTEFEDFDPNLLAKINKVINDL